jgi:hypothetical protein
MVWCCVIPISVPSANQFGRTRKSEHCRSHAVIVQAVAGPVRRPGSELAATDGTYTHAVAVVGCDRPLLPKDSGSNMTLRHRFDPSPCFVPLCPRQSSHSVQYLNPPTTRSEDDIDVCPPASVPLPQLARNSSAVFFFYKSVSTTKNLEPRWRRVRSSIPETNPLIVERSTSLPDAA